MGQEQQMRRLGGGRRSSKNVPIFSHEFIIQNHADIVSTIAMVFVAGMMLQITAPLASCFVILQHNVTTIDGSSPQWYYQAGWRDVATIFFYSLICIVVHAVIQEYVVDKLQRKMHLSKTKTAKFNESGQLIPFCLFTAAYAAYIVSEENYLTNISLLWNGYPTEHRRLTFAQKLFFILQIAYWIHTYPEFYFQKSKKEDIRSRSFFAALHLLFIVCAYALNFTRVAVFILLLHASADFLFHVCRIAHFAEKHHFAVAGFKIWNIYFVLVRLGSATLAMLTFWYGMKSSETPIVDLHAGNFNTAFIRLNSLLAVCGLQVWMMWNFINFHFRRLRERYVQTKSHSQTRSTKKKSMFSLLVSKYPHLMLFRLVKSCIFSK
ncbi:unnamed protein product [Soboliphyme baturini]|uniref:Translocating chain-associated membrane protein n=1 Tax=Soboliphyme baturini TaxID=241478 RepID=A0A183II11_9BILA|nr:unnamed protein product [Soboliphyme baturini]